MGKISQQGILGLQMGMYSIRRGSNIKSRAALKEILDLFFREALKYRNTFYQGEQFVFEKRSADVTFTIKTI